jgi:hypothetical protein
MAKVRVELSRYLPQEASQAQNQQVALTEFEQLDLLAKQVQLACLPIYEATAAVKTFFKVWPELTPVMDQDVHLAEVAHSSLAQPEVKFSSESDEDKDAFEAEENRSCTSVMMCNIPNNVSLNQLLTLFDANGFNKFYNFVYLPIDLESRCNVGYAFINLAEHAAAINFYRRFTSFSGWKGKTSKKVCKVKWASMKMQGLDAYVERYRNSAIMHESVPFDGKPVIFKNGQRVKFPPPTKRLAAPRQRPCDDKPRVILVNQLV